MALRALSVLTLLFCLTLVAAEEGRFSSPIFLQTGTSSAVEVEFVFNSGIVDELAEHRGTTLAAAWLLSEPDQNSFYNLAVLRRRVIVSANVTSFRFLCRTEYAERVVARFASVLDSAVTKASVIASIPDALPSFFEFPLSALKGDLTGGIFDYPPDANWLRELKQSTVADYLKSRFQKQFAIVYYRCGERQVGLESTITSSFGKNPKTLQRTTAFDPSRVLGVKVEKYSPVRTGGRWTMRIDGTETGLIRSFFAAVRAEGKNKLDPVFFCIGNETYASFADLEKKLDLLSSSRFYHDSTTDCDAAYLESLRRLLSLRSELISGRMICDAALVPLLVSVSEDKPSFERDAWRELEQTGRVFDSAALHPGGMYRETLGVNSMLYVANAGEDGRIYVRFNACTGGYCLDTNMLISCYWWFYNHFDYPLRWSLVREIGLEVRELPPNDMPIALFPCESAFELRYAKNAFGPALRFAADIVKFADPFMPNVLKGGLLNPIARAVYPEHFGESDLNVNRIFSVDIFADLGGRSVQANLPSITLKSGVSLDIPIAAEQKDTMEIAGDSDELVLWARLPHIENRAAACAVVLMLETELSASLKTECTVRIYPTNWGSLLEIKATLAEDALALRIEELLRQQNTSEIDDEKLIAVNDKLATRVCSDSASQHGLFGWATMFYPHINPSRKLESGLPKLERHALVAVKKQLLGGTFRRIIVKKRTDKK